MGHTVMAIKWKVLPMPDTNGQKWELKSGDTVLGTIFYKRTTKKYALWLSTPLVVAKVVSVVTHSHQCKTLEEAVDKFRRLYMDEVLPWAENIVFASDLVWEGPDASDVS